MTLFFVMWGLLFLIVLAIGILFESSDALMDAVLQLQEDYQERLRASLP